MPSHLFYSNSNAYYLHNIENKQNRKMIAFRATRADSYHVMCRSVGKARYEQFYITPHNHYSLPSIPFNSHNKYVLYLLIQYVIPLGDLNKVNFQLTI